jgi:hypothetical protein
MGLTTPETERIVIPRPEPLELPACEPGHEPAAPLEPAVAPGTPTPVPASR